MSRRHTTYLTSSAIVAGGDRIYAQDGTDLSPPYAALQIGDRLTLIFDDAESVEKVQTALEAVALMVAKFPPHADRDYSWADGSMQLDEPDQPEPAVAAALRAPDAALAGPALETDPPGSRQAP